MFHRFSVAALLLISSELVVCSQFTVNCDLLTVQFSDPIFSPGEPGPHVHAVVGGTAFNRTESPQEAVAARDTTCDKVLDHSNYWEPQLYHIDKNGLFNLVPVQQTVLTYKNAACNYVCGKEFCTISDYSVAPPAGLEMVAGFPTLRTFNASDPKQQAITHQCINGLVATTYNSFPTQLCERIVSQAFFPSCWDGIHLITADFSHVAYPAIGAYDHGVCPASHPIAIYSLFYQFHYDTSEFDDYDKFVYAMGDPTGYGLHGVFINGWTNQTRLNEAMKTCTGLFGIHDPHCSLIVGSSAGSAGPQALQVPAPNDNVGLNGPIAKLLGDNPVTGTAL